MLLFYFIPSVIRIMVYFLMLLKFWTEWKWDARIVKLNLCIDILNKTIEKILKKTLQTINKLWYYWLSNSLELDRYK